MVELNKWQYFSVVQKSDGTTTLYKNGSVVATGTTLIANNINRSTNYISGAVSGYGFIGRMNSLSLFNRSLNDAEVQNSSNTVYAGTETGLVGYWPLFDLSSGQVEDMGPKRYTGLAASGVTNVSISSDFSTPFGDALAFDGTSTYVKLPSAGFTNFTNGFSAGMWVYPTATTNWGRLFDFGNGQNSDNIILCRSGTTNNVLFSVRKGSSEQTLTATNALTLNTWQYISVVQQANGTTTIYRNGTSIATGTVHVPNKLTRSYCYIGKSNGAGVSLYAGRLNDLSIWNRALTASEMTSAPSTAFNGSETGLVGYWPMNEGSGGTVNDRATGSIADRSPNAFTGTVTSTVYSKTAGMNALTFDGSANSYVSLPSSGFISKSRVSYFMFHCQGQGSFLNQGFPILCFTAKVRVQFLIQGFLSYVSLPSPQNN